MAGKIGNGRDGEFLRVASLGRAMRAKQDLIRAGDTSVETAAQCRVLERRFDDAIEHVLANRQGVLFPLQDRMMGPYREG